MFIRSLCVILPHWNGPLPPYLLTYALVVLHPQALFQVLYQAQCQVQCLHHHPPQVELFFYWTMTFIFILGCGIVNKMTILSKLSMVKKVKTALECQKLCADYTGSRSCTHFLWKNHRKVTKRTCTLQVVGYKTKKNFVAGPLNCWKLEFVSFDVYDLTVFLTWSFLVVTS